MIGWVDPVTGEQQRFFLSTRDAIAPNFDHEKVKQEASAPINIEFDQEGNAWFVNLQTNQIGRISLANELSLYEIEGFGTTNTRPINIFEGPQGFIWVTVEGDNRPEAEGTKQSLGGIARFDPASATFKAYPQKLSKGAGGVLGVKPDSVWFQYQEEALVRLDVDASGRRDQTVFELPDIGERKRVMHRIGQGPDGSMWFTSLQADLVSQITTEEQGLPVYSFDASSTGNQYLSSLPQEWTLLLAEDSGFDHPDPLFLSTAILMIPYQHRASVIRSLGRSSGQLIQRNAKPGREAFGMNWLAKISAYLMTSATRKIIRAFYKKPLMIRPMGIRW